MCGIFACANSDDAANLIVSGLKSLEYRGYDSWGIGLGTSLETSEKPTIYKRVGGVGDVLNLPDFPKNFNRYRAYKMGNSWRSKRYQCPPPYVLGF